MKRLFFTLLSALTMGALLWATNGWMGQSGDKKSGRNSYQTGQTGNKAVRISKKATHGSDKVMRAGVKMMQTNNKVVRYDFTKLADVSGVYTGTLQSGAVLTTYANLPVLALGSDNGYMDLGSELGNYISTLQNYTVSVNVFIPETTDIKGNGNFVWCFSKTSDTGYLFLSAKDTRFAISETNYRGEQAVGKGEALPKGKWLNVVYMQSGSVARVFVDKLPKAGTVTLNPKTLGHTPNNYLGKSCYQGDAYLKGAMYNDLRIYNYNISAAELNALQTNITTLNMYADSVRNAKLIAEFRLPKTEALMEDIVLPKTYAGVATIRWKTSDAHVITEEGHVTRPPHGSAKAVATLTAYIEAGAAKDTLTFEVSVLPEFSDAETLAYDVRELKLNGKLHNLYDDLSLPSVGTLGSVITWKSSDENYLSNVGKVRKYAADEKKHVVLTATLLRGKHSATKTFDVYLHQEEPYTTYLFVYFPSNKDENIYYALSDDGYNYTPLNNGQRILSSDTTSMMKGLRDPHILRAPDGTFYMVATDMKSDLGWSSNRGLVLMKSRDLIHWTHSVVHFPTKYAGTNFANVTRVWAPETIWDANYVNAVGTKGRCMVYFSLLTNDGTIPYDKDYYCYTNDDFTDLLGTPTFFFDRGSATIDMNIVYNESDSLYHGFYKNEGSGGICKVTAKCLTPAAGEAPGTQWSNPSGTLQQTTAAVEGAGVFKLINQDKWILMYDCYSNGYYQFCSSDDLSKFTFVKNTLTSGAFTPRHGTVIPITREETEALLAAFPTTGLTAALKGADNVNIDQNNLKITADRIFIPVARETDISRFDPQFRVSTGTKVSPIGAQDFSSGAVTYTLTNGSQVKTYRVVVEVNANPVLPSFHADPEVLLSRKTGRFYIYPTTDGYPGWGGYSFNVFSSPNLVDFTDEGTFLNLSAHKDVEWASGNAWAPSIEEKWIDGKWKYYFYFSGHNPVLNKKTLGVAVSESPTGPFVASSKPLFTSSNAGQMIDSDVFTDPVSRQSYLYYGNGKLCYRLLSDDMMSVKGNEYTITPIGGTLSDYAFREGVHVFYRNGIYYFMWSVDDTGSANYHVAYGTSTSPVGPITIAEQPVVLIQDPINEIYGTGHHSVVNVPGTDDWYIVYHRINKNYLHNGPGTHREVCVDKLTFDESGHINKVAPTRKGITPVGMDDFIRQITDVNTINNADATAVSIAYYTVDGIKLGSSEPDKAGLYIRRELLSNGLVRSFKMLK